jgi:hypothetical protein
VTRAAKNRAGAALAESLPGCLKIKDKKAPATKKPELSPRLETSRWQIAQLRNAGL